MSAHIRPALPTDAAGIATVNVLTWQQSYQDFVDAEFLASLNVPDATRRWERILNQPGGLHFVMEAEGQIIGYVSGGPDREDAFWGGEVYALYLLPSWHGKGLGRQLFEQIMKALKQQGHARNRVWVFRNNPFRAFYQHMGGEYLTEKTLPLGKQELVEEALGWGREN